MVSLGGKTRGVEKEKVGQLDRSAEAGQNQDWTMVENWCQKPVTNQAIKACLKALKSDQVKAFIRNLMNASHNDPNYRRCSIGRVSNLASSNLFRKSSWTYRAWESKAIDFFIMASNGLFLSSSLSVNFSKFSLPISGTAGLFLPYFIIRRNSPINLFFLSETRNGAVVLDWEGGGSILWNGSCISQSLHISTFSVQMHQV